MTQEKARKKAHTQTVKHGITREFRETLLANQQHRCPVCSKLLEDNEAAIDHDHACCPGDRSCGQCVRGLLHIKCNAALGLLEDNALWLHKAAAYLEKYEDSKRGAGVCDLPSSETQSAEHVR